VNGGSWCLFDRVVTVMVVGRLLEGSVLLVTGRRDQRRRRRLTSGVLERELERRKVVQQHSVVSLSRQVWELVRHRGRRRFRVLDDPGHGLGPVRFGRRVPGRGRVVVGGRLQMQRVHQYRPDVGVHHRCRLLPRRTVSLMVRRRRHGCGLLQRLALVVVEVLLLLLNLQLAGEGVGDGAVHNGRRVVLYAVIVVVPGRHTFAAVRVPVASRR